MAAAYRCCRSLAILDLSKERISAATAAAIKYGGVLGVAAKAAGMISQLVEAESDMRRRIALLYLVDSILQATK